MRRDYVPVFSSINTSIKLADLPDHRARLFYLLLLPQCDSWGRCTADVRQLCVKVWPLLGETVKSTGAALIALQKLELVHVHELEGVSWLQIPDWEQKAGRIGNVERRGISQWPDPPETDSLHDHSDLGGLTPDLVESESGSSPPRARALRAEQSRREEKRGAPAAPVDLGLEALTRIPSLDTPDVRTALGEWVAYRRESKLVTWKASTWRKNLEAAVPWGPDALVVSIQTSIRSTWHGLFEPKVNGNGHARDPEPSLPDSNTYWAEQRAKWKADDEAKAQEAVTA